MSEFKNLPSGWKVVRLGDVFEKITIKNRPDEPILTIKQGIGTILRENSDRQILFDKKRISTYKFVKNNDFIIHLRSFEGGFEMSNHQGIVSPAYIILRNKILISHLYFKNFFRSHLFIHKILAICVEGIRDGKQLNFDTVKNLKIPFPPLDEQEKIAEILSTWDEAINLTTNLIESKRQFKKALMQNLLTAKIRFPQFKDDWEIVKLEEISEVYQPQTISQSELTDSGFDVYGANGIIGKYSRYNHEFEQVVVACRGNTCGAVNFTKPKSWITGNAMVINLDNSTKSIKTFIYYLLSNTNFQYLISGSGQPQITSNIRYHKIKLPNLKEQQKIAEVLTACDDEINLLNLKLENFKKQKQGLMQKPLSGKVRVRI